MRLGWHKKALCKIESALTLANYISQCDIVDESTIHQLRSVHLDLEKPEVRDTEKTLDEYIAGKIFAKEAAQQVYARYGAK